MFVRWQTYRSQALYPWRAEQNDRRARLEAILVESVRVDGKPRQKHIAFLGSIQSDDPKMTTGNSDHAQFWRRMSANSKAYFWRDVTLKLKRLGNRIGPEDHDRIVASIAAKVGGGPLTEAELEQLKRAGEAFLESLGTALAGQGRAPRPARRQRPLRDRVEEAGRKYAELQLKLDRETMDAAFRLKPASRSR
jgi:hypothetical protein